MKFIADNYKLILELIGTLTTICTLLGVITPSNKDKTLLDKIGGLFDRIGINIKGKK